MGLMKISVAMATHNEAANITRTLESVYDWVNEIIIVDGESTDETVDVIKKLDRDNKIRLYAEKNPPMFHINKQKALEKCTGDWILQLDADELVSAPLKQEIQQIINPKSEMRNPKQIQNSNLENSKLFRDSKFDIRASSHYVAYWLPRLNYFLGRPLRKGGQYPDYTIRLYRNGIARFPCRDVHEQVTIDSSMVILSETAGGVEGSHRNQNQQLERDSSLIAQNDNFVGHLKANLLHYPYPTFADYVVKWKRYSRLEAGLLKEKGVEIGAISFLKYVVYEPTKWFLLTYFRHKGFMDGIAGFVFCLMSALRFPLIFYYLI